MYLFILRPSARSGMYWSLIMPEYRHELRKSMCVHIRTLLYAVTFIIMLVYYAL